MEFAKRVVVAVLVAFQITGCITFNGKELPRVRPDKLENPEAVVVVEVGELTKTFNGKHGDLGRFNEGLATRLTTTQVARIWKGRHLIADFGFPGDLDEPATHKLIVNGTIDESGSIFGAVLTGATLYIIPSVSRMTYDLTTELQQLQGDEVVGSYEAPAKNSYSLWQWIVFVPTTLAGSIVWGSHGAERDRSFYLWNEFNKQGAFDPPAPPPAAED